jgi:predicted lipid-binding transport protein (Tim44 family)
MAGIAGGIAGSWLGGLLFGHSGYAGDGMGASSGSMLGGLFQLILIGLLVWFVVRLFRRRGGFSGFMPGTATAPSYFGTTASAPRETMILPGRPAMPPLQLSESDFNEFTAVLTNVQSAWSAGDLNSLRHNCTPEMLSYFAEELAGNQSRDVINKVENVTLLEGEPREAWSEGNAEYATAYLRWSARDYTVRAEVPPGTTAIVSGDAAHPVEAAELWTFMRSPGGHWLLSAIQQV